MNMESVTLQQVIQSLKDKIFPRDAIQPSIESQYIFTSSPSRYYICCSVILPQEETLETLEISRQNALQKAQKNIEARQNLLCALSNPKSRRIFHFDFHDVKLTSKTYGYKRFEYDSWERYTRQDLISETSRNITRYQKELERASSLTTFSPDMYQSLLDGNIILNRTEWMWSMYILREDVDDFIQNINNSLEELVKCFRSGIIKKIKENKQSLNHLPIPYSEIATFFKSHRTHNVVLPQDLKT